MRKLKAALPWLSDAGGPQWSLEVRKSHIMQALNVAYARHENVAGAWQPGAAAPEARESPGQQGGARLCRRRWLELCRRPHPCQRLPPCRPSPTDYFSGCLRWLEQAGLPEAAQDPLWYLVNQWRVDNLAALTGERAYDDAAPPGERRRLARRLAAAPHTAA